MATRKRLTIEGIPFSTTEPTAVPLADLYAWVVWQFPRQRAGAHGGAVHPPEQNHGWYPAVIDAEAGRALIYANIDERFPTPEAAARHLD